MQLIIAALSPKTAMTLNRQKLFLKKYLCSSRTELYRIVAGVRNVCENSLCPSKAW